MSHADPARSPASAAGRPAATPDTSAAPAAPAPVDWSEESTAGEEDPGASLDLALDPPPEAPGPVSEPAPAPGPAPAKPGR